MMSTAQNLPQWMQWAWALAGTSMLILAVVWALFVFWPYLRLTKKVMLRSLELSEKTADHFTKLQDELKPILEKLGDSTDDIRTIITDGREALHEVNGVIKDVKARDLDKVRDALERVRAELDGQGKLHRIADSLEKIASLAERTKSLPEKVKTLVRDADGDFDRLIYTRVDAFLSDVFSSRSSNGAEEA